MADIDWKAADAADEDVVVAADEGAVVAADEDAVVAADEDAVDAVDEEAGASKADVGQPDLDEAAESL